MPQTAVGDRGYNALHDLLQNDWKNGYDANWIQASSDGIVLGVLSAEPGSPARGYSYILGASPSGANWGGDSGAAENKIAVYMNVPGLTDGSPWKYLTPGDGWRVYDRGSGSRRSLTYDAQEGRWIARAENEAGMTVVDDNGGDYTPTLAEENGRIILSSAFDQAGGDQFVIPQESAVPYKVGTTLVVCNKSAGSVTVVSTGITFDGGSLASINNGVTELVKMGSDTWAAVV